MRTIYRSKEFDSYFSTLPNDVQTKVHYALNIVSQIKIVNTKLAKKLIATEFYELRISKTNEYRFLLYTIDADNLIEAEEVIILNGFVKKSTLDYRKQIAKARKIIKELRDETKN